MKNLLFFRYASLYFVACIEPEDNELIALEVIHRYVELLDKYFGNVSYQIWMSVRKSLFNDIFSFSICIAWSNILITVPQVQMTSDID